MPADATIVSLCSDTAEAPATRRDAHESNLGGPHESNPSSPQESSRNGRSRGPRSRERHTQRHNHAPGGGGADHTLVVE
jgi:hypothetical protein